MAKLKTIEGRVNGLCTLMSKPVQFDKAISISATKNHKKVTACRSKLIKCGQKLEDDERAFAKKNFVKPMAEVFPEIHNRKEMAVASKYMRKFMKKYHKEHNNDASSDQAQNESSAASSLSNSHQSSAGSNSSSSNSSSSNGSDHSKLNKKDHGNDNIKDSRGNKNPSLFN